MTVQNRKIGFIGAGKMGSALMQGIIKAGIVKPENLGASDVCSCGEAPDSRLGTRRS